MKKLIDSEFKDEFELRDLINLNAKKIFGVSFLDDEFYLEGKKLDSLCFCEVKKTFLVIEYKVKYDPGVLEQVRDYLRLMKKHPAELREKYWDVTGKKLSKKDVNMDAIYAIIVAPHYSSRQVRNITRKMNLYVYKLYNDDILVIDQFSVKEEFTNNNYIGFHCLNRTKVISSNTNNNFIKDKFTSGQQLFDEFIILIRKQYPDITKKENKKNISLWINNISICTIYYAKYHFAVRFATDGTNKFTSIKDFKDIEKLRNKTIKKIKYIINLGSIEKTIEPENIGSESNLLKLLISEMTKRHDDFYHDVNKNNKEVFRFKKKNNIIARIKEKKNNELAIEIHRGHRNDDGRESKDFLTLQSSKIKLEPFILPVRLKNTTLYKYKFVINNSNQLSETLRLFKEKINNSFK